MLKNFRAAALAGLATMTTGLTAAALAQEPEAANVIAIVAHPDDELVFAPALADAAADGAIVTIIYATRGDAGPGVSDFAKGEALAAAREAEARCASSALGLEDPVFLDYGDGTLHEQAQDESPDGSPLERELRTLIGEYRPATIVTWGPDGGYGHADHRLVSAFVTEIVQTMDSDDARPQLLYPAIPEGSLPPIPELQRWATTAPELITVDAEYDADELARAGEAAQCHATQFDAATRGMLMQVFDQSIWRGAVHFRRALPNRKSGEE